MTDDLLQRALRIADRSMFAVLQSDTVAHDEFRTVLGLTDDTGQEVATLAEASPALQEAVAWLLERDYVQLSEDPSGQYVDVNRRPGEDDDDEADPGDNGDLQP
jgi:hypothetical protein